MIYKQSYTSPNKNQVKFKKNSTKRKYSVEKYKQNIDLTTPEGFDNYICKMGPKERAGYYNYLRYQISHITVYAAQSTIANNVDCTREYINKCTQQWKKDGAILKSKQKGFNKTCNYRFPAYFFRDEFRAVLSKYFPLLKFIPLSLLITLKCANIELQFTLRNISNKVFNFIDNTTHKPNSFYGYTNAELLTRDYDKPILPSQDSPTRAAASPYSPILQNTTTPDATASEQQKELLLRYLQIATDNLRVMTSVANPPYRTIEKLKEQIVEYEAKLKRL